MDQTLLETFEGLKMTDRQKRLFSDVLVERIRIFKNKHRVDVFLKSTHLIPYREISLVKYNLEMSLGPAGFSVRISGRSIGRASCRS